jgi:hypothetical protein
MWHEVRREMLQLFKSLFRIDFDVYTRKMAVKKFKAEEEFSDIYDPESECSITTNNKNNNRN